MEKQIHSPHTAGEGHAGTWRRRKRNRKLRRDLPMNGGRKIWETATVVLGVLSAFMAITLAALLLSERAFWETPLAGLASAILLLLATAFYGITKNMGTDKKKRRFLFWSLVAGYTAFLLHSGLAVLFLLSSL